MTLQLLLRLAKKTPLREISEMPKSKIYCLIHINTGTSRYLREMPPTLANELNRSLQSHNSPLRWITAKEFGKRKELQHHESPS